jgi:hypothetical protein
MHKASKLSIARSLPGVTHRSQRRIPTAKDKGWSSPTDYLVVTKVYSILRFPFSSTPRCVIPIFDARPRRRRSPLRQPQGLLFFDNRFT